MKFYEELKRMAEKRDFLLNMQPGQKIGNDDYWEFCDQMYQELRKMCIWAEGKGEHSVDLALCWEPVHYYVDREKRKWLPLALAEYYSQFREEQEKMEWCTEFERDRLMESLRERMELDGFPEGCLEPVDVDVITYEKEGDKLVPVKTGEKNHLIRAQISWLEESENLDENKEKR